MADFNDALKVLESFCMRQEGKDAKHRPRPNGKHAPHKHEVHDVEYNRLIGILQKSRQRRRQRLWYQNMGRRYTGQDRERLMQEFQRLQEPKDEDEFFLNLGAAIGRSPKGVRWELAQVLRRDGRSNEALAQAYGKSVKLIKLLKEDQVHSTDLHDHVQQAKEAVRWKWT